MTLSIEGRARWPALVLLCLGELMIVLDTTIVNVALPSIKADLGFTETSLVWVVNAYMLTFGGCLLLGGRLGDLYGHRRLFLAGISLFTVASVACGLANSQGLLVAARAVQGLGGAVVSAVALSLIMNLFTEPAERAKAMGIYGFVCAGGGSIGVLLGGILTSTFSWHWIFLVNVPIGVAVHALCVMLLPSGGGQAAGQPFEHRPHLVHVPHLVGFERGHDQAAPWSLAQHPLLPQQHQGLLYGLARHTELLGQLLLDDAFAGRQPASGNLVQQRLAHTLDQVRGGGQGLHHHGSQCSPEAQLCIQSSVQPG